MTGASISRSATGASSTTSSIASGIGSSFRRDGPAGPSALQVAVDWVDLLKPAQALADVLRSPGPDALDGFEVIVARGEHLLQATELLDDPLHNQLGEARNSSQDAVAAGRYGEVECRHLAVVAEQLREAAEVEQVLVRHAGDRGGGRRQVLLRVLDGVVADQARLVGSD